VQIAIRSLSPTEKEALNEGLALAARVTGIEGPLSVEKVQELYNALLNDHPSYENGLISCGLAFGELIASRTGYE
jgi:hypothetical protein